MKKIHLTNEQRVNLEHLHANTRDSRICDRIKAVLLRSENWSLSMIAQALRLHETTVIRHINDYIKKEKLKPENGGSAGYLSNIQTEEVVQHLNMILIPLVVYWRKKPLQYILLDIIL